MSDRIVKAVKAILDADPKDGEDDLDLAEEIVAEVERLQAESFKFAVVGQILVEGAETPQVVVLGPFGGRGKLEDQAAWKKAAETHAGSRTEGGKLAFRSTASPSTARGRFMLAPIFPTASKAWKFFPDHPQVTEEIEVEFQSIRGFDLSNLAGPACTCGHKMATGCFRHPEMKGEGND